MYVVYSEYEQHDYGYGGWTGTTTNCYEIHYVAWSILEAQECARQLRKQFKNRDVDYEEISFWETKLAKT